MQTQSTIELIAAEIAQLKSAISEAESSGLAMGTAAIGPLGSIDDYVARQRNLEELLSFYRPSSAADAAILAAQLSERATIVRDDYARPAGLDVTFGELDRLAAGLADWHGVSSSAPRVVEGGGLLAALAKDLEAAWRLSDAADAAEAAAAQQGRECAHAGKDLDEASATIHAIETGMASARVRSAEDAASVCALLYAEIALGCADRSRLFAMSLADYLNSNDVGASATLRKRYGPRFAATTTAEAEASAASHH